MAIDLTYPAIVDLIGGKGMTVKQQSRQLLLWFLLNYYRLGDIEAADSVCDEVDDKGVDGIHVNDGTNEITVLSSKLRTGNPMAQLGHGELKELAGTIAQFRTPEGVQEIIDTTRNAELKKLLSEREIVGKIRAGYTVSGLLVTNGQRNDDAIAYLGLNAEIDLFDGARLVAEFVEVDEIAPINSPVVFDLGGISRIEETVDGKLMVVAPIAASSLIQLDGIVNEQLFAPNVRQWLGAKTNVNRALEKSISDVQEHGLFPAYHNGLTVLCETLELSGDELRINGYGVANGCQSLRGFYEKRASLTDDLRVLVKFINERPGTPLAQKITDHTNNQNGISARDLKSNQLLQTRLQTEINSKFAPDIHFRIKRGERLADWPKSSVIDNVLAGRILLAFKTKKPEATHQAYKVFEDLYEEIFSGASGDQIVVLHDIYSEIVKKLRRYDDGRFLDSGNILIAEYSQTPFLVLGFLRGVLDTNDTGRKFVSDASFFVNAENGRDRLKSSLGKVVETILRFFNSSINRRRAPGADEIPRYFDYKREFKSPSSVSALKEEILAQYGVALDGKLVKPFNELWSESATV